MNYPYANGIIAAIDNRILDLTQFAKLIKVKRSDFINTLIELGYGESHNTQLDTLINNEISRTKALLDEISPQKHFTDLFYLENDVINIKALYKAKIFAIDNKFIKNLGIFSYPELEDIILNDNLNHLPKDIKKLFTDINTEIADLDNPRLISTRIDNALYRYLLRILEKHRNPILKQYFQARIDIANILTIIRAKALKWDLGQTIEMFIEGGLINKAYLRSAFALKNINNAFRDFYNGRLDNGLRAYSESGNINDLEKYFDELILEMMAEYRFDPFSIGPIVYYFLKKQAEAKNIRLIYANDDIEINKLLKY